MTTEEFNNKYKDYLVEGYYGCELGLEEALKYLNSKFQEYVKLPNFKYQQIKSKFYNFCFYAEGISNEEKSEVELELSKIYNNALLGR